MANLLPFQAVKERIYKEQSHPLNFLTNPTKSPMLSSFSDKTQSGLNNMQQGEKEETYDVPKNPMVSIKDGPDVRVGNLREFEEGGILLVDRIQPAFYLAEQDSRKKGWTNHVR
ncbi:unnamed protein product [Mucor hiemalis]